MFESGRFNLNRPDLNGQKEFLTWAVIIIVFGSIIYYFIVFFGEMWQITGSNRCVRLFMRKKKNDTVTNEDIDDTVILDTNPLHAQLASSPLDIKAKQDEMANALKKVGEQNDQLRRELMAERRRAAEELARFEHLVKQGLVVETEDDRLDEDEDDGNGSRSGGGSFTSGRRTVSPSKKGRGKGTGMSTFLGGKTVSAGAALEHDRALRATRTNVSRELGPNTKLNDAYKESVSYQDDTASGNPIFTAERGSYTDGMPQAIKSIGNSLASLGDTLRRKTLSPTGARAGTVREEKSDDA